MINLMVNKKELIEKCSSGTLFNFQSNKATTMSSLSNNILAFLLPFSELFSKPTWKKALTLLLGTLLCTGKRTVCAALRSMGLSKESGFSKYHYLLNKAEWSSLRASKILFSMLLVLLKKADPIVLMIDETLERRKGAKIKAKGYYRDAVRSSKSQVVKTTGLEWLVWAHAILERILQAA